MNKIPFNFLAIPDVKEKDAEFVIMPVGYEKTTTGKPGTKYAPFSIIFSSREIELFDEELNMEIWKETKIKTIEEIFPDYKSEKIFLNGISKIIQKYAEKGKIIVGLGGEHTLSYGFVKGIKSVCNELKIIHLDAHLDLREKYQNTKFSHACVMRRIYELGCEIFSFGIRNLSYQEKEFLKDSKNINVFWAYKMIEENWGKYAFDLPKGDYYISIDTDFFDPSFIPETGTPEPGGFNWWETIKFLRNLILREDVNIRGFDIVELSPKEIFSYSSFICAKLIYKIIGYIVYKRYAEGKSSLS